MRSAVHWRRGVEIACTAAHLDAALYPGNGNVPALCCSPDPARVTCKACLELVPLEMYEPPKQRRRPGPVPVRGHGTPARARRHYRDGEKPCEACREAAMMARRSAPGASGMSNSEARRDWWRRKKAGLL